MKTIDNRTYTDAIPAMAYSYIKQPDTRLDRFGGHVCRPP
jgi:hypothetical protein